MKYQTKISKIGNNDVTIRDTKLSHLIKNESFSNSIFLLLSGRKPSKKESILFEKILISIIDHGMGTTSSMTSRFVASGGNSLNVGVGAGLLSIGDYHGGAIENCMKQFYELKEMNNSKQQELINSKINDKQIIYGFGHKIYKNGDPRVKIISDIVKEIKFESKFITIIEMVETSFNKIKNKKVYCNIDGLIAALLCDFGFDSLLGKGIFLIGRTPGLVAQTYEELKFEKPVRRIDEEEIEFVEE